MIAVITTVTVHQAVALGVVDGGNPFVLGLVNGCTPLQEQHRNKPEPLGPITTQNLRRQLDSIFHLLTRI